MCVLTVFTEDEITRVVVFLGLSRSTHRQALHDLRKLR
jgi:hypothetical protein